jgi:Phage terminase large subunit (GpA)
LSRRRPPVTASAHLAALLSPADQAPAPFHEWASRVPEPKGELDFDRFPFQRELYRSSVDHPEVVIKKAAQVGVSAFCIRWAMYWAGARGLTALHVFPRQRQLRDFSDARIKPLIATSPLLRELVAAGSVQNNGLKRLGVGYLILRGSESVADLQAVDADVLVLDEYDDLAQDNVPDAERRLAASKLGLVRRVGVPSYPDYGIAGQYNRSDRRRWFVRCAACGLRQPITWENVDRHRLERVCTGCARGLDVRDGEWVAEFPDRDMRGYHLSRLIVPSADIGHLVRASRETDEARRQAFVNKDLGQEYASEDARLSSAFIAGAQRDYSCPVVYSGDHPVTMGADVASVRNLHVRISEHLDEGRKRALFLGEVRDFEALDELMDRYGVDLCSIDAQPEHRLAAAFAERFPGRIFLVNHKGPAQDVVLPVPDERRVVVARTQAIDAALADLRMQRNELPRVLPADYAAHLQAVIRLVDRDDVGRKRSRYHSLGPDDYLHSEVFDWVAWRLRLWQAEYAKLRQWSLPELVPIEEALPGFVPSSLASYGDVEYHPGGIERLEDRYDR